MQFSQVIGEVLRAARSSRGLTLKQLELLSGGRFKHSVVGEYERAERSISLERFFELARVYGTAADRLLAQAMELLDPEGRQEIVVDLARMELLEEESRRLLGDFVNRIRERRGDHGGEVVTLRSGDIQVLAASSHVAPGALLAKLKPALRE